MAELSPAAHAVWNAAWVNTPVQCGDIEGTRRAQVAAALRAAADRARRGPEHWEGSCPDDYDKGWNEAVDYFTTIANELVNADDH